MSSPQEASERRRKRRELARLANLSVVGLVFPTAIAIGFFAGRLIGGWLGNPSAGGLIGAVVGIFAGFYNLIKVALQLSREETTRPADNDGS